MTSLRALAVALLATNANNANAFSPSSMKLKQLVKSSSSSSSLHLWVNDFSKNGPPSTTASSLEARVEDCLQSLQSKPPSPESIQALLHELELLQNDCTEEGNQTSDECDISLKEKRDKWIKALEEYKTVVGHVQEEAPLETSAILPSIKNQGQPIEAQVQSCLESASVQATVTTTTSQPLNLFHVLQMRQSLEDLQNECTEEGNQTKDECDVVRMEERFALMVQLDELVQAPSLKFVQTTLDELNGQQAETQQEIFSVVTHWLTVLEEQTNLCSEEGHQTSSMCDIRTMEWRADLQLRLEEYLSQFQTKTVQRTQNCLQYQLCNTDALKATYANLEELEMLCTEEGNQTRSFCNLDAKEERQALMEQISHQLDLAEAVVQLQKDVSFQI
jgi:hypothetical protein